MEISRKFQTEQLRGLAYNSGFYFQASFTWHFVMSQLVLTTRLQKMNAYQSGREADNIPNVWQNCIQIMLLLLWFLWSPYTQQSLKGVSQLCCVQAQWRSEKYSMQLFCAPVQACTLAWQDTDRFFERLQDWSDCPIELRRPFCFYYGHLPSFFKLRLLKVSASAILNPPSSLAISGHYNLHMESPRKP